MRCLLLLLAIAAQCVLNVGGQPLDAVFGRRWDVLAPLPALLRGRHDVYLPFSYIDADKILNRNVGDKVACDVVNGGFCAWNTVQATNSSDGTLSVNFGINNMDYDFLTSFFGIGGADMSAIFATSLEVPVPGVYRFGGASAPDNFFVDRRLLHSEPQMGSDGMLYKLEAGNYTFWTVFADWSNTTSISIPPLRLVTDNPLVVFAGPDSYLPDIVDGRLASRLFSVNVIPTETLFPWDLIVEMSLRTADSGSTLAWQTTITKRIEESQPFQLALQIDVPANTKIDYCSGPQLNVTLKARGFQTSKAFQLRCQNYSSPYRFVFSDIDESAQYAMVWAPATESCPDKGCPVIRALHGNGVESSSDAWTYSYKQQAHAWILMPTNRDKNGYDWETSGSMNAWMALKALETELPGVPERLRGSVKADITKILYTGHSMGGHGTMAAGIHDPDLGVAIVPMSGWLKHSIYVPDLIVSDWSHLDHHARGILENAIGDSDDDLLVPNVVGLPAFIRYGDADDNVPPLNLRRWHRLLSKYSADHGSTAPIILDEQPGKGHWFDNIMDDAKVQAFFDQAIANGSAPRPELPPRFTFANLNPSTSGSRGGIRILQTKTTGRIASFAVDRLDNGTWILESNNVATLELRKIGGLEFPETLVIDGHPVQGEGIYRLTSSGVQQIANVPLTERSPANYGPARRVFETGPFWIVYAEKYRDQALWLAQEVFARGRFSPELRPEYLFKAEDAEKVNLVVLGGPEENAAARWISNREVGFESGKFKLGGRTFASPDQGVVYLTPTSQTNPDRLALVVAGNSPSAVEFLMRYVPAHSEKRAPDYMVCDRSRYWQGLGACVAGGFWDAEWKFDRAASYGI